MDILQEIAIWAQTLPKWQSDAVRRIFTQEILSAEDESELYALLLHEHGIADRDVVTIKPSPFSTLVEVAQPTTQQVLLKEIHSLDNVNALLPGQS